MIKEKLAQALNEQINKEIFSEYLYLSMAAYAVDKGMGGFSNWFIMQAQEEHFHAMKIFHYLNERGARVVLEAIGKPEENFSSIIELFHKGLEHEKYVTQSINDLVSLARGENDYAMQQFLGWFVEEQVEEEASFETIIAKLEMLGDKGAGLIMMDNQLGARTFAPPEEEE